MNIRIISGHWGGRKIETPDNSRTHPMGERVRNAMFNSIGDEIVGAHVLDVFAGTGSIGLEALSRGAAHATFVERDRLAQKILAKNIKDLDAKSATTIIRTSAANWLETREEELYDIIFADPPYHDAQLSTVARIMGLLKPNGLMVLSHIGSSEVPIQNKIVVVDNRSYGNAHLTYYRRK